jgi:hypothetical protein
MRLQPQPYRRRSAFLQDGQAQPALKLELSCHLGDLGSGTSSNTENSQQSSGAGGVNNRGAGTVSFGASSSGNTGSGSGQVATGKGKVNKGSRNQNLDAGATAIGGSYTAPGAAVISGAKGPVTVTTSDPAVLNAALLAMSSTNADFAKGISDLANSNAAAQASTVNSALKSNADLASSQQTGGATAAASTVTKILLGGLAIVAVVLIAFFWKKK